MARPEVRSLTLPVRRVGDPRESPGARFEAPVHTHPYPLDLCAGACLDARDLDLDDGFAPLE